MSSMLNAALDYAARGWHVFPCSPRSKIPFAGSSGSKEATTDERIIRDWWLRYPDANVAIATGSRSGIYVIDVDAPNSEDLARLAPTLQARTPRRGWHYIYRLPQGARLKNFTKESRLIGADTDGRGEGGYIVAWPSVVAIDGAIKPYEWVNLDGIDIAMLPQWIADLLTTAQRELPREAYAMQVPAYGQRALDDEAMAVARCAEGGRNDALNRASFRLAQLVAGGHLSQAAVEHAMMQAGMAAGLPQRECIATIRSGINAGLQHPRGPAPRVRSEALDPNETDVDEPADVGIIEAHTQQTSADAERWSLLARVRALGGLCDTIPGWIVRGADHPQPMLTLAAMLALGATMGGRRLVWRGSTSSLFICAVAPSGDGKNRPQACVRRLIGELWGQLAGPTSFSSSASLIDHVRDSTDAGHGTMIVVDEYGMQLRGLIGTRVSAHRMDIKQILTELATVGLGSIAPAKSRATGGGAEHIIVPSVSLLGSTTPESLHSILGGLEVADGFVGRHLWFTAQTMLPEWQPPESRGSDETPIEVRQGVERLRAWHEEWFAGLPEAGISSDSGRPIRRYEAVECTCDDEAVARLNAFKVTCDERKRSGDTTIPRALLGRSPEYATRLALVLATLASPELQVPHVTGSVVEVAIDIANASAATFASSLAGHSAPAWDDHESQVAYVTSKLESLAGTGRVVSRTALLRAARKLSMQQVDTIIDRLVDEDRLTRAKQQTKGRAMDLLVLPGGKEPEPQSMRDYVLERIAMLGAGGKSFTRVDLHDRCRYRLHAKGLSAVLDELERDGLIVVEDGQVDGGLATMIRMV